MIVFGLDVGTTTIGGVAFDAAAGRLLSSIVRPNRGAEGMPAGEQSPESIAAQLEELVRELTARHGTPAGIGVSGQMHGIVYVDGAGRAVSPLYTWQDRRGQRPAAEGETIAERLTRLSGYPIATGYGLATHAALIREGAVPPAAKALCTIADYAVMRLAGAAAPMLDASNAASLGCFDARRGAFDTAAMERAGLDPAWLPQVAPSAEAAGRTPEGALVFNGIGDNQASALGSARDLRRTIVLNVGTGGQLSTYAETYASADGLDTRPFPGGGYLLVGASLAGGKAYAMLERLFRSVLEAFAPGAAPSLPESALYERMEGLLRELEAEPVSDPLRVRTQFYGTRLEPDRRGSIEGIGPSNFTPAHLVRGFLQGMTEELYGFYRLLPAALRERRAAIVGSGNGLRRNASLRHMCEERFGLPLVVPPFEEEAAVGAALHAAVGLGARRSHADAWEP